jgi:two-component system sensor histidine kinase DesK
MGTASELPDPASGGAGVLRLAPTLARTIVITVFCGIALTGFMHILYVSHAPRDITLSATGAACLLFLQIFCFSRPNRRLSSSMVYGALALQACLVYVPMIWLHEAWVGMPGFFAGSVLLVLAPRLGWTLFALAVCSTGALQYLFSGAILDVEYTSVSTIITGLVVYGLSRLAALVNEVHDARLELTRMAIAEERLRFARDLHDLLGYSLSAITLKCELTYRLVTKHPDRAQSELAEILPIARQALSDVRWVASSYRELSFEKECQSVRSVLAAAEVDVQLDLEYQNLPANVSTVLATMLREGVTNLLRHSKATHCDITVRQTPHRVTIDLVNDGVSDEAPRPTELPGCGARNLQVRVETLGGTLSAEREGDDLFRLHADIPLPVRSATAVDPDERFELTS